MNSAGNFEALERDMKTADRESGKVILISVLVLVLACAGLAAVLFQFAEHPMQFSLTVIILLITATVQVFIYRARRRRAALFEKHGFRCQSCHRTPYSLHLLKRTSTQFCPFCQLKYFP